MPTIVRTKTIVCTAEQVLPGIAVGRTVVRTLDNGRSYRYVVVAVPADPTPYAGIYVRLVGADGTLGPESCLALRGPGITGVALAD